LAFVAFLIPDNQQQRFPLASENGGLCCAEDQSAYQKGSGGEK
jgi:hypothetical protein